MIDKKNNIIDSARELFYLKGFKDTNISDIAKNAGIGVGTFYNYYPSKEAIFLEIYSNENDNLKKIMINSMDLNEDPVSMITKLVIKNANEMNSNLILKEWYNKELFNKLEKSFYEQGNIENFNENTRSGKLELIQKWKSEGKIRNDIDDDMINAIFNSILYIDIHKEEIGIQYFPQILIYITEFIMKGLTNNSEK